MDKIEVEFSCKILQRMSFSKTGHDSVQHTEGVAVVVDTQNQRLVKEAELLIGRLGETEPKSRYTVYFGKEGVELRRSSHIHQKGFRVNFSTIDRRTGSGNLSKKQPIAKAMGEHKTIIDATAGFGKDAALLALIGYSVTAIERSPIISTMLRDGLFRAQQDDDLQRSLADKLELVESNSIETLKFIKTAEVVYIDPMFPQKKKKSALPPGHIQALHSIVGHENQRETKELFKAALVAAGERVVIKRPKHLQYISNNPIAIHEGKLVRYEVYQAD